MTDTLYKVEVTTDDGKSWATNALKFATIDEATVYGRDLHARWLSVDEWRIVTAELIDGKEVLTPV